MELEEERRVEADVLGAEDETGAGEEPPLFVPTPSLRRHDLYIGRMRV